MSIGTLAWLGAVGFSFVLGRLVLTPEEARRTLTVRLPAAALLIVAVMAMTIFSAVYAVACFIGGSIYGLYAWWMPTLDTWPENTQYILNAILTGEWPA